MRFQNRRATVLAGVVILLALAGIVLAFKPSPKSTAPQDNTYVDTFSHQTVSSPEGKTPENYGTTSDVPLYLGFSELLNYGLSSGQLENIETAFYNYSKSLKSPLKTISVDVDHITVSHDPTNPNSNFQVLFNVQFDRKDIYKAKAEYSSLIDVRLLLSDTGSKQVYDSGTLYVSPQSQ